MSGRAINDQHLIIGEFIGAFVIELSGKCAKFQVKNLELVDVTLRAKLFELVDKHQDITRYRGVYDEGFDVLRTRRLERLAKLGLIDAKAPAHARLKPEGGWTALSAEEQAISARDMEIYAAMVENLDRNVGRVMAQLQSTGALDNTVIIFLSDNGPEGMDFRSTEIASMRRRYEQADNTIDNRGAATSFVSYGPGWASASAAPARLYKTYSTEGGTRVASFVSGPKHLLGNRGIAHAFATAADILPTVLDWAGVKPTASQSARPMQPLIGRSWRPYLTGAAERIYGEDDAFGTELFGSRSIRMGDWKITDIGDGEWGLFNIATDPGETTDLSYKEPAKRQEMLKAWDRYARENNVILPGRRFHNP